jgi:hypothetical protein
MNKLFSEAAAQIISFDPALLEMQDNGVGYFDWVATPSVPRQEVIRTSKALLKACWKRFVVEPNPLLVEMGVLDSQERKLEWLKDVGNALQDAHSDAYLELYGTLPAQRIGFYALRSGSDWIEINNIDSALKSEIQAMAKARVTTSYLK